MYLSKLRSLTSLIILKKKFHLTYIFISHDLSVIGRITNRVVVMYVGKIVEISETDSPFKDVKNPHPEALFSAVLVFHPISKSKRLFFPEKFLI